MSFVGGRGYGMSVEPEYVSSITLIVLGKELDPPSVTRALKLRPNQAWRRGDLKELPHSKKHEYQWGGWKRFSPESHQVHPFERQLLYWCKLLKDRAPALRELSKSGATSLLDCFVTSSATASILIPVQLQEALGKVPVELHLSFFASQEQLSGPTSGSSRIATSGHGWRLNLGLDRNESSAPTS